MSMYIGLGSKLPEVYEDKNLGDKNNMKKKL